METDFVETLSAEHGMDLIQNEIFTLSTAAREKLIEMIINFKRLLGCNSFPFNASRIIAGMTLSSG